MWCVVRRAWHRVLGRGVGRVRSAADPDEPLAHFHVIGWECVLCTYGMDEVSHRKGPNPCLAVTVLGSPHTRGLERGCSSGRGVRPWNQPMRMSLSLRRPSSVQFSTRDVSSSCACVVLATDWLWTRAAPLTAPEQNLMTAHSRSTYLSLPSQTCSRRWSTPDPPCFQGAREQRTP